MTSDDAVPVGGEDDRDERFAFDDPGLSPPTRRAIEASGYAVPTPIQVAAIPIALGGVDVIGGAATGTGKTAAYLIPSIERLARDAAGVALVLAPTRELAAQIAAEAERLGGSHDLPVALVVGGSGPDAQARAIEAGARIVVATPGRLLDLADQGRVDLGRFDLLVLDEADRMLDVGFETDLDRVAAALPSSRQTLLFSATVGDEVERFARSGMREPVRLIVDPRGTVPGGAAQAVYFVPPIDKPPLLLSLLREVRGTTLVFARTKARVDRIHRVLRGLRLRVERIHGSLSTSQRTGALERFSAGKTRILVATNVAARGLDVASIAHVVNYDLTDRPEEYVHRVGRTARMDREGRASTFVEPGEGGRLLAIERLTRDVLEIRPLPGDLDRHRDRLLRRRSADAETRSGPRERSSRSGPRGKSKRRRITKEKARRRRRTR